MIRGFVEKVTGPVLIGIGLVSGFHYVSFVNHVEKRAECIRQYNIHVSGVLDARAALAKDYIAAQNKLIKGLAEIIASGDEDTTDEFMEAFSTYRRAVATFDRREEVYTLPPVPECAK